jgi:hypothetical protein
MPGVVRESVLQAMGSPVVRGRRVFGGYGPTPTFRLTLADGRRVFFKGTNRTSNDFARGGLAREERVYRELSSVIGPWAPQFYAAFQRDDWHVLLLEDVGPKSVPPWMPAMTRRIAEAYASFHASTLDIRLPSWLPRPPESLPRVTWRRIAAESENLSKVAALVRGRGEEALDWLQTTLPLWCRLTDMAANLPGPYALLHGDTRSDNLRFSGGRLSLFDWPSAEVGRPEFDVVAFAQSVTVDGGVEPELVVQWYGNQLALREEALDTAVAWLAAFFADLAWRPDIPGLPRLRRFQRQQLSVVLRWGAQRLHLPEPTWVTALV